MTDVVVVCDPSGNKLDELPVAVQRSWKLERTVNAARGTMSIPVSDAKAIDRNLLTGNLLLVYSDAYPTIPNWAGVVWNPDPNGTTLSGGMLTFGIRSTEWLLHDRLTDPITNLTGVPGDRFKQLLAQALKDAYLPISTDYSGIAPNGTSDTTVLNLAPCYEAANDLANNNDAYWWLDPTIDTSRNTLLLKPMFLFKRSSVLPKQLVIGGDANQINFIVKSFYEFTEISNRVTAVGKFDKWDNPLLATVESQASIARYKQIYHTRLECPDITDINMLTAAANAELNRRAFTRLMIDGIVTSAPYPRVGDVCTVEINDAGQYITSRRGTIVPMQCDSVTYTPQDPSLAVHLTEVIL